MIVGFSLAIYWRLYMSKHLENSIKDDGLLGNGQNLLQTYQSINMTDKRNQESSHGDDDETSLYRDDDSYGGSQIKESLFHYTPANPSEYKAINSSKTGYSDSSKSQYSVHTMNNTFNYQL